MQCRWIPSNDAVPAKRWDTLGYKAAAASATAAILAAAALAGVESPMIGVVALSSTPPLPVPQEVRPHRRQEEGAGGGSHSQGRLQALVLALFDLDLAQEEWAQLLQP